MNKANFRDFFKSLAIILVFIVIIGLLLITTYPEKFKNMIFGKNIIEGNKNINSECFECAITVNTGPFTTTTPNLSTNKDISSAIVARSKIDISNVLPRTNGDAMNLYTSLNNINTQYVFCSWNGQYNTTSSSWLDNCTDTMYNDVSCCLQEDGSRTDFYTKNYIIDTSLPETSRSKLKYYGMVFKYENIPAYDTIVTASEDPALDNPKYPKRHIITNDTKFKFTPVDNDKTFIDGRFKYKTSVSSSQDVQKYTIETDDNGNVKKIIDCKGDVKDSPSNRIPSWSKCNLSQVTQIPTSEVMNLATNQRLCWKIGSTFGEISMNQYCEISNIDLTDCSKIYLPRDNADSLNPPIDSIFNNGRTSGTGGTQNIIGSDTNNTSTISSSIKNQLQFIIDGVVNKFQERSSIMNNIRNSPEVPNIGVPTFLNIGTCNNNSPYVYNSSCQNSTTSQSGNFDYQYQCYPSITGDFSVCGPPGYLEKLDFS